MPTCHESFLLFPCIFGRIKFCDHLNVRARKSGSRSSFIHFSVLLDFFLPSLGKYQRPLIAPFPFLRASFFFKWYLPRLVFLTFSHTCRTISGTQLASSGCAFRPKTFTAFPEHFLLSQVGTFFYGIHPTQHFTSHSKPDPVLEASTACFSAFGFTSC
jgi:hypothetical protein